jgi:NADH-quinone oxidoreductase subunit M
LLVAIAPLTSYWLGALGALISLIEVGIWITAVGKFDFSDPHLQFAQQHSWIPDLNVSYHVGMYAFSLWLVGMTVIVLAACVIYGWWVDRARARAYFSLMLVLTGSIVGVFTAQDLLLFYAFFEAMLIPLYILIGVWGGARRTEATVKFVIYTMAGSLLMLAAVIAYGLKAGTFDLVTGPTSASRWLFLGFMLAFVIKAPLFPFHGWLPDAYREAPPEIAAVLSGVIAKAGLYGMLRIAITKFPDPTSFYRTTVLALAAAALVYGSLLAFRSPDFRGVVAYSSLAQSGLIALGLFAGTDLGFDGAVLQMVAHGLISISLFLIAGAVERRTTTGEFRLLGGMARGRPALATLLMTVGVISLAVPGSASFAGEFLILAGVFQRAWWWSAIGAGAIVLAAMYMLRLISAVLHEARGSTVADEALDLRPGELALLVPLVCGLLFLSAWPAGISNHSFFGPSPTAAVKSGFK